MEKEEEEIEMYEHIKGAQLAAFKLGDFQKLSILMGDTLNSGAKKLNTVTKTDGLFCIECHKPVKHS
jgi:hypothetical protein